MEGIKFLASQAKSIHDYTSTRSKILTLLICSLQHKRSFFNRTTLFTVRGLKNFWIHCRNICWFEWHYEAGQVCSNQ